jgi:hypothetical protein
MFRKAAARMEAQAGLDEGQVWRVDYGTPYRDAAALLTLAVEAGSQAVDREALADRIATQSATLSTQEATWALLAAHALSGTAGADGIVIDGQPAGGALVRMLGADGAPVSVRNDGPDTTLTVTSWGIPAEPEPEGGTGYAITRTYYTLGGEVADPAQVKSGTRLVTVLEVTPFGNAEARLMVNDPLPAGFEIDNPNLLAGGAIEALDWLNPTAEVAHSEFRQDRFLTAIDWRSDQPFRLAYVVRAVSPGTFHHPAASVEDMYRPAFRARSAAGRVTVSE